ncbi:hypothetical protein BJ912DRAFT_927524 [Pholiota molesta]|nr:hypothetical protein BJ912DRAFT_927524 [Pholiota molesta]
MSASSPDTQFEKPRISRFFSPVIRTLTLATSLRGSAKSARRAYQAGGGKYIKHSNDIYTSWFELTTTLCQKDEARNTDPSHVRLLTEFAVSKATNKPLLFALYVAAPPARSVRTKRVEENTSDTTYSQFYRAGRANGDRRHSMPPDGTQCLDPCLANAFEMQRTGDLKKARQLRSHHGSTGALCIVFSA